MKPQIIKSKDKNSILDRMDQLAKSYTPDWAPDFKTPDFGSALALIFKDMYLEQAQRINRLPEKQRRDIVNLFDPLPYGPAASKGFVCFELSEGASDGLFLEKGFQLLAEGAEASEIHFETTEPVYVSHARLNKAVVYDHESGWLSVHEDETSGLTIPLFEVNMDMNQNAPSFEISDPKWLYARRGMKLGLRFSTSHDLDYERLCEGLSDTQKANWTTIGLEEDVTLEVECVDGVIWILIDDMVRLAGKVRCDLIDIPYFRNIEISDLTLELSMQSLIPDKLMYNDVLIDPPILHPHSGVKPFTDQYNVFDVLLIGDNDAFNKPGAHIQVQMKMMEQLVPIENTSEEPLIKWRNVMHESELREPEPRTIRIESLIWEYWNGIGWMPLDVNTDAYTMPSEGDWTIDFTCPNDMESAIFGPAESTYIRARITKVQNAFAPKGMIAVPILKQLSLFADTSKLEKQTFIKPNQVDICSNMETRVFTSEHIGSEDIPLASAPDEDIQKVVYISLTAPLEKGPIRFEVNPLFETSDIDPAMCKIQYYGIRSGREGWHDQPHEDETDGFITNGLISFMAPKKMTPVTRFNTKSYWIRLVPVIHQKYTVNPKRYNRSMHVRINAVPVMQMETLTSEYYAVPAIQPWATLYLSRAPILKGHVWINELGVISDEEIQNFLEHKTDSIYIENDKRGEQIGVWIKWTRIDNFNESSKFKSNDGRVYIIDLELGKITFGDGKLGRIPHSDLPEYIRVDYALGGGVSGNVGPGKINKAVTSIPFLERVYNGSPIWGGLGTEHTLQAEHRISEHIRHRGMALSGRDIEAIIKSHNRDIHDVKATGGKGQVKISVLPDAFPYQISHFFEIKDKTENILIESMSAMVTDQERFTINEPVLVAFSVNMDVVVESAGDYIKALSRWHEQLEAYFHPLHGGPKKDGWRIGQLPEHASILADLKHMLQGSELIDNVMIQMHLVDGKKRIPIHHRASGEVDLKHAIPVNGEHDVRIRISDY